MSERISRSEQKRQHKQIEDAARELCDLGDQELKRLPASIELKNEIAASRKTKGGARKRQVKYIAKLLKQQGHNKILSFLQSEKGSKIEENRFNHEVERLRDSIVDDALTAYDECRQYRAPWEIDFESSAIEKIVILYPAIDVKEIRRSAHQYVRNRNKVYYRELFRLIKAAADKKRLDTVMTE